MFDVDPLLLRLFVRKVLIADLQLLCGKVSTSILIMRLAQECTDKIEVSFCEC